MRDSIFGLAKETTFGTAVTTPTHYPPVVSAERTMERENIEIEETIGVAFPSTMDYGSRYYSVTAAGAARAASFPRILSGFLGEPTTTTPGGGTTSRQHAFEPVAKATAGTDHFGIEPHTLYVENRDYSPVAKSFYAGALGNEFNFSVEPNGFGMFSANWYALTKDTSTAAPTATMDATRRFTFDEVKCYVNIDAAGENEIKVGSASVTMSNNIDTEQLVLGQLDLHTMRPENRTGSIAFTPRSDIRDWWLRAMQDDPARVKLRLLCEGPVIEAAIKWTVEFTVHHAEISEVPGTDVDAGSRQKNADITGRAAYSTADSAFISARVINTTTSY